MGKVEKELLKSYWHARHAALDQDNWYSSYEPWEINPDSIKQGLIKKEHVIDSNSGRAIAAYLSYFPDELGDFADEMHRMSPRDTADLLIRQPQFANQFDLTDQFIDGDDEFATVKLLTHQPQFAEKLDMKRVAALITRGYNVLDLITAQPQLRKYFDLKNIFTEMNKNTYSSLGYMLRDLIIKHPKFITDPDIKSFLPEEEYIAILKERPELINHLDISNVSVWNKLPLVAKQPDLYYKIFDDKLDGNKIAELITLNPKLWNTLKHIKLESYYYVEIMKNVPELRDEIMNIFKPSKYDIDKLVKIDPKLIKNVDFSEYDQYDVLFLLRDNPQAIPYMKPETIDKLSGNSIVDIIKKTPSTIKYFDLSKLNKWDIHDLIEKKPELKKYFPELNLD